MGDIWGTPTSWGGIGGFKQTVTQKGADGSATTVAHEVTPQAPAAPAAPAAGQPGALPVGPPPASLAADPAYNAFLNSLGLSHATLTNAATLRAGQVQAGELGSEGPLMRNQAQSLANGENAMDARGTVNSGANLGQQAHIQAAYGDRLAALRNGAANSVANIYADLASRLAAGDQQLAAKGTNIAGNDYVAGTLASSPFGSY